MWEEVIKYYATNVPDLIQFGKIQVDSAKSLLVGFTPSLQYYGGPYSSGGHPDWPQFC